MIPETPFVSVIVPARNEEACLTLCLESLVSQGGIAFEVIVVDDESTDRTPEIARSFANLTVISAPQLPENWTGKNNAMFAGAKIAKGKWLLFTDADTVHKPGSLARAVGEAEQKGAALLSYSPEQEVHTFWEKAVMPVIFAELAATYPPKKVNDPDSPIAAANGQYLMISREAYDAVGGHTKIANDLLEDVAMARLVKSSGRKIFFRYGGDAVRTRMYRSWAQMKEGWTKNLALLFKNPIELAIVKMGVFVGLLGTGFAAFQWILSGKAPISLGGFVVMALSLCRSFRPASAIAFLFVAEYLLDSVIFFFLVWYLLKRSQRVGFRWKVAFISLLGLPLFSLLLLRSTYLYRKGRLHWKDRTYIYTAEEIETLKNLRADGTT
jgi:glycosyltransferase involved in cell wall biosynthesis